MKIDGKIQGSKSLLNRAYMVKSYHKDFEVEGKSSCDDILVIKKAIESFQNREVIDCKDSGTAFRFMVLRSSRTSGEFVFTGSSRLFQRHHEPLESILSQLGVQILVQENQKWIIQSQGWRLQTDALTFSSHNSSQFASSVMLNSFDLDRDLFVSLEGLPVSLSYLEMTLQFLKKIGFMVQGKFPEYYIPAGQKLNQKLYKVEPDMSNLFALSCVASLKEGLTYNQWPESSLQPDSIFPNILSQMGVHVEIKNSLLKVQPTDLRRGISIDLCNYVDLFPCLAVLCCLSEGESVLYGVPHIRFKESDRLKLTFQLIQSAGRKVEILPQGIKIEGSTQKGGGRSIIFNPQGDHRMAMAAGLLQLVGFNVKIKNQECVSKSFPHFWSFINE